VLNRAVGGVLPAAFKITRDGDAAMQAEARRILTETRRSLSRLLAEDGVEPEDAATEA
jgi:hypothetical protein